MYFSTNNIEIQYIPTWWASRYYRIIDVQILNGNSQLS